MKLHATGSLLVFDFDGVIVVDGVNERMVPVDGGSLHRWSSSLGGQFGNSGHDILFCDRIVISKVCFFSIVRPRSFWLEGGLLERNPQKRFHIENLEFLWHLFVGCDPLGVSQISVEREKIENLLPRLESLFQPTFETPTHNPFRSTGANTRVCVVAAKRGGGRQGKYRCLKHVREMTESKIKKDYLSC